MEGKYIINMPKGTTPRTRKILEQQQAAKGIDLAGMPFGIETAFPLVVWCRVGQALQALAERQALVRSRGQVPEA